MRVLLAVAGLGMASVASAGPLDQPPLTAAPAELLALAKAAPDAATLFDHEEIAIDAQGRATRHRHRITVLRGGDDEEELPAFFWNGAFQDRPVVRIRVIDPSGQATVLEASQLVENTPGLLEPQLGTALKGVVIEEDSTVLDRMPRLAAGQLITHDVGAAQRSVVELSAPIHKAHVVTHGLPKGVRPIHQIVGGRERWRYELGPMTHEPIEISLTTAASWAAIAQGYRAVLEAALADPAALPAELRGVEARPPYEVAGAITAWVHRAVKRRRDPELGTPTTPAATLARGTANITDKAVLLVSLLRQAKLRADVVAMAFGAVDPDLPGLEAFHDVLVKLTIAGRDVWIDPSDPLLPVGTLGVGRSRRSALVIAAETRGLIVTPAPRLEDNAYREVRTFVAAEVGPAQVTEVSHTTGAAQAETRHWARTPPAELAKQLADYVAKEYAGRFHQHTVTPADDLDVPLALTVEAGEVRTVVTSRDKLEIELYPRSTLLHVPWQVTHPAHPDAAPPSGFDWPLPHSFEIENRIVVPVGFTMPALAPDRVRSIGTAQFAEHQAIDGQTLVVTFRFETGKPRLTPAEAVTLQAELSRLQAETVHLKLRLTAAALAEAGKLREALAEAERLLQLHPKEARHRQQLASILIQSGAGEAARREARRAVELEPKNADAYVTLGWVLMYDTLGRTYGFDWDRAGAIAALRQARALDPKHLGAVSHLAEALVHNPQGRYAEAGADLEGALEAQRSVLAMAPSDDRRIDVVRVLARLGRFTEAKTVLDATAEGAEYRDSWRVALAAALGGAPAGIQVADALANRPARTATIDIAASVLMLLGKYDIARGLAAASGTAATLELTRATAHPALPIPSKDPRIAAMDAMIACTDVDRVARSFLNARVERGFRAACATQSKLARNETTATLLADAIQTKIQLTVEGDADAWRVEGTRDHKTFAMYVALDRGVAVVLGDNADPAGVGIQLDRLIARGRDAAARRLADWLAKDATGGAGSYLRRLWAAGQPRDRVAIRRVAGAAMSDADAARAQVLLGTCSGATGDAELACHQLLIVVSAVSDHWPDVLVQDEWLTSHLPGASDVTWRWAAEALARLGRFDEAEHRIDELLARHPDAVHGLERRIAITARHGDLDEALRRADALVNGPSPTSYDLNQIAWLRLFEHHDVAAALVLAQRAVRASPGDPIAGSTLAAIQAELGDPGAALPTLLATIPASRGPNNDDWYVLGRIYEQLGRTEEALAAYRRVTVDLVAWASSYVLAAQRLTAMHATH